MPLELGIWRIDGKLQEVTTSPLDKEERLEDILAQDITIASPNWMVIGRQIRTSYGGFIDLLAMDRDGNLVVIELKRDHTPRNIVAQVLDYASWVKNLKDDDVSKLFQEYQERWGQGDALSLDDAFRARFATDTIPELNESHELVIVASALDDSTERIVSYLSELYGVPINAVFFRVFKDGDREYITRAWLRDPTGTTLSEESPQRNPWNGEYYSSFGNDYDWESAQKFNYIVAGGGPWYSRTMFLLEPGGRVWVNAPGKGYIGVCIVEEEPVKADEFLVIGKDGSKMPITQMAGADPSLADDVDSTEKANYLVRVKWLKTVPRNKTVSERGFFGNQNSVCQPRSARWEHTVNRLKVRFEVS